MALRRLWFAAVVGFAATADELQDSRIQSVEEDVTSCLQTAVKPTDGVTRFDERFGCDLMVITTYFTTLVDWQRNVSAPPKLYLIEDFFKSAQEQGINVTVLYDDLPQEILDIQNAHFKFARVNLSDYDAKQGLNDKRFNMVRDLVDRNPSWQSIFLVDLFDVVFGKNPCPDLADGKLYVGRERDLLRHNTWMEKRFVSMGGKYEEWYRKGVRRGWYLMNAGVVGGRREMFTKFLQAMTEVLNDPEIAAKKLHQQENVNMAALNYVVRVSMNLTQADFNDNQTGFVHDTPVHSEYKWYQDDRKDVWFIHK